MGRELEIKKEDKWMILQAPHSIIPFQPNLSRELSTHGHTHAAEDILQNSSD